MTRQFKEKALTLVHRSRVTVQSVMAGSQGGRSLLCVHSPEAEKEHGMLIISMSPFTYSIILPREIMYSRKSPQTVSEAHLGVSHILSGWNLCFYDTHIHYPFFLFWVCSTYVWFYVSTLLSEVKFNVMLIRISL